MYINREIEKEVNSKRQIRARPRHVKKRLRLSRVAKESAYIHKSRKKEKLKILCVKASLIKGFPKISILVLVVDVLWQQAMLGCNCIRKNGQASKRDRRNDWQCLSSVIASSAFVYTLAHVLLRLQ
jgi:hypothetical protein